MSGAYIKNFNYSIFLSLLLLLLITITVSRQGAFVTNLYEFEKKLVIKKILSCDSLFKFDSTVGVLPKEQNRKLYRIEFVKGRFAVFTLPVLPVNTKFIESKIVPIRGPILRCTCDSNNIKIINDSSELKKFLTYKLIVLPNDSRKTDLLFSGFTLYISNSELASEKNSSEPCLKIGKSQYYLETNYYDENPYPELTLKSVDQDLQSIKRLNGQDTLSDEEFYVNTLRQKEANVKIPLVDVEFDTKKSSTLVTLISICFAIFGLNMFRRARIEFRRDKSTEAFFLNDVSNDITRTLNVFSKISITRIRFDSFFILAYHFIGFLCPFLVFIITSLPRYEGEKTFFGITSIVTLIAALCCVTSYFYNYILLISSNSDNKVFLDIQKGTDLIDDKVPNWLPKWFVGFLIFIDEIPIHVKKVKTSIKSQFKKNKSEKQKTIHKSCR